jgi:thiol-disulfide isomerase/thioredoxin
MSNRSQSIVILAVVIITGLGYLLLFQQNQPESPGVNEEPPSVNNKLVFTTTDRDRVTIDDLLAEEKPLIIYFFTTWCSTCRKDLENLYAAHPLYEDEISVLVVGFSPTESLDTIRDYKEGRDYSWPFAGYNPDAITKFQIVSQASKVGISLDGEVVFTEGFGVVSEDGWKDLFRMLT